MHIIESYLLLIQQLHIFLWCREILLLQAFTLDVKPSSRLTKKLYVLCHMITASTIYIAYIFIFLLHRHTREIYLSSTSLVKWLHFLLLHLCTNSLFGVIWDFTFSALKITIFGLMSYFFFIFFIYLYK